MVVVLRFRVMKRSFSKQQASTAQAQACVMQLTSSNLEGTDFRADTRNPDIEGRKIIDMGFEKRSTPGHCYFSRVIVFISLVLSLLSSA